MKPSRITAESLRADAERRQREREKLAADYEAAADVLLADDSSKHRSAVALLRQEALSWRANAWKPK